MTATPACGASHYVDCEGDSLTFGPGVGADTYPNQLATLLGAPWVVENYGVGGNRVELLDTTDVDARYVGERTKSVLVILIGTNDILLTAQSGADVYAEVVAYCQARRATGHLVIVCTIPGWDIGTWGNEADRLDFNDLVRTNWATFADAFADPGADPDIGTFAGSPHFIDSVHLTASGYAILAGLVHTEVIAL